jgi:thymidylate synthase ThyX
VILWTLEHMEAWDCAWREFENIRFLFEIVVSASCYAQLKRHRMTTQIVQRYDPRLGITIPETVRNASIVGRMRSAAKAAQRLHGAMSRRIGGAADYALTNAHRRRVLLQINLRELYHFSRLRSDAHAQWEIRSVSDLMCRDASRVIPAGAALLGGKDELPRLRERLSRD